MGLFKKKEDKTTDIVHVGRIIELGKDTIALGGLNLTDEKTGNFFVRETVVIATQAVIVGDITATNALISGRVVGNVICTEIWLGPSAVIEGTVMARDAVFEDGCVVNGTMMLSPKVEVKMLSVKIAEAEKAEKAQEEQAQADAQVLLQRQMKEQEAQKVKETPSFVAETTVPKIHQQAQPKQNETTQQSQDTWW